MRSSIILFLLVAAFVVPPISSMVSPAFAEIPEGDPVFSDPTAIDNEFFPFEEGAVKVYTGRLHEDGERAKLAVVELHTDKTREFPWMGGTVTCVCLQETEFEDGEILEISLNYFAQADDGTVYYFGETVDNYEDGVIVDHDGSWLVGGPQAGDPVGTATAVDPAVFMPGTPEQGDVFFPEDLFPFVHERDEIIKTGKRVVVPAGQFLDCVKIKETSLLSSGSEVKWYAPGVGVVQVKERGEILELHEIVDP